MCYGLIFLCAIVYTSTLETPKLQRRRVNCTAAVAATDTRQQRTFNRKMMMAYRENKRTHSHSNCTLESETAAGRYEYCLQEHDISHIAKIKYGFKEDGVDTIFCVIGGLEHLDQQLRQYQNRVTRENETRTLTIVYNLNGNHWVTLVVTYQNSRFFAYYCDSLGCELPKAINDVLFNANIEKDYILDLIVRQQYDGYNCGIFALENANRINDKLQAKSTDMVEQLEKYRPTTQELIDVRKSFGKMLSRDESWIFFTNTLAQQASSGQKVTSPESSDEDIQAHKNSNLFVAKKMSEEKIIEEIEKCLQDGAEINAKNTKGKTALDIAIKKVLEELKFLLEQRQIPQVETIIGSSGQRATSSQRQSTGNDEVCIFRFDTQSSSINHRKNPHASEGEDGAVSLEKSPKDLSDKPTTHKEWLDKLEIPSEGTKLAHHGNIFQLKLLMLFLWRAKESDYTAFRLATELSEAEKFDDVAFQYQQNNGGTWKFRLLQAKHKEGTTVDAVLPNIKTADLLSTDDNEAFSLQKYFRSYLKIKQRSKKNSIYSVFSKSEIEDVCVITNIDFDSELRNYFTGNRKGIEKDELLKVHKHRSMKWPEASVYKLKKPENNVIVGLVKPIFENTSDFHKLVEELADHILEGKQIDNTGLFKDYYYPSEKPPE